MIDGTLTEFDEGDLVDGTVVKLEHDEVLVDIGFKSEGVIPARELSIRKDADPSDIVSLGDKIEALVLQKEDKDGRLILSKKRAEYERAWISVEEKFKAGEVVTGEVIEVVRAVLSWTSACAASFRRLSWHLRRVKDLDAYLRRRDRGPRHRDGSQPQQRRAVPPRSLGGGPPGEAREILSALQGHAPPRATFPPSWTSGAFVGIGGIDGLVHLRAGVPEPCQPSSEVVRWATRWRSRCSTSICSVSASPSVSSRPRPLWIQLVEELRWAPSSTGRLPDRALAPSSSWVNSIEGLVHISEMAAATSTPRRRSCMRATCEGEGHEINRIVAGFPCP